MDKQEVLIGHLRQSISNLRQFISIRKCCVQMVEKTGVTETFIL